MVATQNKLILLTAFSLFKLCSTATFVDDLGVAHDITKKKPTIVVQATYGLALHHLGTIVCMSVPFAG